MAYTGLTRFFMAKYSSEGGTVTYSEGGEYLKAIELNPEIEKADDGNNLYANNKVAESSGASRFGGGTLTIKTDDLPQSVSMLILGVTPVEEVINGVTYSVVKYGNNLDPPYLGFGVIRTGQVTNESGNTSRFFRAYIFTKIRFSVPLDAATTQGETIEWQTPELSASIYRDDTPDEAWHVECTCETEEQAAEFILNYFGIVEAEG
jgi:hypothetical protein